MVDAKALIVYSLPGESEFQISNGARRRGISSKLTWIMRPFDQQREPIYFGMSPPSRLSTFPSIELNEAPLLAETMKDHYLKNAERSIDFATKTEGKVILSRIKKLERRIDLQRSLGRYREMYPNSFVYLFHAPDIGTWMGATPEVLLSARAEEHSTYALAGTRWGDDLFSQKEFDEQMLVVRDILDILSDREVEVGDVRESVYGNLRHLKTELRWIESASYMKISELLHPTAAVNGFPRREANGLILKMESHPRRYYTGYLGIIEAETSANLFVNLRCMQLFRDSALLYAGGGINSKSDPKHEWEECGRKFKTIEEALEFDD